MLGIGINEVKSRIRSHGIITNIKGVTSINATDLKRMSYKTVRAVTPSSALKLCRANLQIAKAEIKELKQYIIELKY